ncbi:MAG: enoyl-CoA hydratase [Thermoplasmata archaeon]|jgi:enoyl-CoA hydratase|nr:enoyl-CoA hydratase [Thermoplasmata archaeon]
MFHVEPRGERVAILRMDDGKVNAMGPAFVERFPAAWAEAAQGGRAIVLAGNAKAFCAGLDLKVLPTLEGAQIGRFARAFMGVFHQILEHPRPVVCAWDGPAMAGGAVLGLCSDLRVATPRARVGLTEMPVGIPFPEPVIDLAMATLPAHEHGPAILQGIVREGAALAARGWAHEVVPGDQLLHEAARLADELASFNPAAYREGKLHLRAAPLASFERFAKDGPERWAARMGEPATREAIVSYFARVTRK